MVDVLPSVVVEPTRVPIAGTVVWLHGLGADGHDFEPIVPMLRLPDVKFVFPHARQIPVTINMNHVMPAWYDVLTLEQTSSRENHAHVRASAELVTALLDREIEAGAAPDRLVLAGFSQGGAMAMYVGNRFPRELAGIMVLSGYEVIPEALEVERHDANRTTPMLFCHGRRDPLVPMSRGKQAYERMVTPGRDVRWQTFAMEHEVCPPEIELIAGWLRERLPEPDGNS